MNRRQWFTRAGGATLAGLALGARGLPELALPSGEGPALATVRLSANENPLGPSRKAREAMLAAFDEGCRYPFEAHEALAERIAAAEGLTPEHVILGAGSGEVLCMAGLAYGVEGGEILAAHPTFEQLTGYAEAVGGYVHPVPLDADLRHDLDAMDRRTTQAVRLVYVCNPNNPTGTLVPSEALRGFCEAVSRRTPVFVDEAYYELVEPGQARTMVDLVREGHSVIVSRTFSKIYGLAGLRVGYGLARPDVAQRLKRYQMAGPNIVGARAALASLDDAAFRQYSRDAIVAARRYTCGVLDELGYHYVPSQANFVFFQTGRDIEPFRAALQEQGVLVGRPFPPYRDWCRVSVGTMEEMQAFAAALRAVT